jgi:hypothetical protein
LGIYILQKSDEIFQDQTGAQVAFDSDKAFNLKIILTVESGIRDFSTHGNKLERRY